MSSSAEEMKMCSISVEPMPSMIFSPVRSWNACQVAAESGSPALTQRRSVVKSAPGVPSSAR